MARRRHTPEQILGKLREVEVALAKGQTVANAVKQIGVTEQSNLASGKTMDHQSVPDCIQHVNTPLKVFTKPAIQAFS